MSIKNFKLPPIDGGQIIQLITYIFILPKLLCPHRSQIPRSSGVNGGKIHYKEKSHVRIKQNQFKRKGSWQKTTAQGIFPKFIYCHKGQLTNSMSLRNNCVLEKICNIISEGC